MQHTHPTGVTCEHEWPEAALNMDKGRKKKNLTLTCTVMKIDCYCVTQFSNSKVMKLTFNINWYIE